jgi:hypothetical protein
LYTSALPQANATGAIATDVANAIQANQFQGSVMNDLYKVFDNGFIGFGASHTSGASARAGLEFDQLEFSFVDGSPLPVTFGNFKAVEGEGKVIVSWDNLTESDVISYVLERAPDGQAFTTIYQTSPAKNDGGGAGYEFKDAHPLNGNNFYRLKVIETNGTVSYSVVTRIRLDVKKQGWYFYPNPVRDGRLGMEVHNLPPGKYVMKIYDQLGRLCYVWKWDHAGGSFSQTLYLDLKSGFYLADLEGPLRMRKKIIAQ